MALQSSGTISLNDIHVEAGGTSGSNASINDADIRGLISKASGVTMSFSEWYGASAGTAVVTGQHVRLKGLSSITSSAEPAARARMFFSASKTYTLVVEEVNGGTTTTAEAFVSNCYLFNGTSLSSSKKVDYTAVSAYVDGENLFGLFRSWIVTDDAIFMILPYEDDGFHIVKYNHSFVEQWEKKYSESGSGLYFNETISHSDGTSSTYNTATGPNVPSFIDDDDYIYLSKAPSCSVYKISKSDGSVSAKKRFKRDSTYETYTSDPFNITVPNCVIAHSSYDADEIVCAFGHTHRARINKSDLSTVGSIIKTNTANVWSDGTASHYAQNIPVSVIDDPSNGDIYTFSWGKIYDGKNNVYAGLFDRISTSGTTSFRAEIGGVGGLVAAGPQLVDIDGTYTYFTGQVVNNNTNTSPGSRPGIFRVNKSNGSYPADFGRQVHIRNNANTGYSYTENEGGNLFKFDGGQDSRHDYRQSGSFDGTTYSVDLFTPSQDPTPTTDTDVYETGHLLIAEDDLSSAFASTTVDKNGFRYSQENKTPTTGSTTTDTEPNWTVHTAGDTGITATNSAIFTTSTVASPQSFAGTASSNFITGTN